MNDIEIKGGLKLTPADDRDFAVGQLYNLPKLEDLPDEYLVGSPTVMDQKQTDFCAMAATGTVSELQEGMPLGFEWLFAVAKMIDGDVDSFGINLRTACKTHTKYGAIERADSPYTAKDKDADFLRRIENWPEKLFAKALKHRKKSFVDMATGPYDAFDNLRASLWLFRKEKRGAVTGVLWSWPSSQKIMDTFSNNGSGHALAILGWKKIDGKQYLVIQNSYGRVAGDNGRHYFSREVINHFVTSYRAFGFIDIEPQDVKDFYLDNGTKVNENWVIQFLKMMRVYSLLKTLISKLNPAPVVIPPINIVEPPPVLPKYSWSTPAEAKHSVRVICDELGLTLAEKNLICAVIQCESGFNTKATNTNKNGTVDYGICQYNSYWYIGLGKPIASIEEAINNPEKCVRTMIKQYRAGRLKDWVCYSSGMYKKNLV